MQDEKFTNNFYAYFPKVRDINDWFSESEKNKKLFLDLDRIIEEENFDVEALFHAVKNWIDYFKVQRELLEKQKWEEADRIGEQVNIYVEQVSEMVYPIYLKMLDFGYPKKSLMYGQL